MCINMKEKKVYFFRIEVKGLAGCQLPGAIKGAFVNCVIPGRNKNEAKQKLKKALREDKYKLVSIDKIEDFYSLYFDENNAEDKEYLQMAKDALKYNEVYYGPFCTWDK